MPLWVTYVAVMRELKLSEKALMTEMSPWMIRRVQFMMSVEADAMAAKQAGGSSGSSGKMAKGDGRGSSLADQLVRQEHEVVNATNKLEAREADRG